MKQFQRITFCLPLIFSALTSGAAMADTVLFAVFIPPLQRDDDVMGGVIFRHVQYDNSHYKESIAGALRITPNRITGLKGLEIDRGEVVMRFSRGNTAYVYGECTMRRAFNDDFDHFVSVQLAEHSPNSNAGENIIVPVSVSAPGKSRSFVSESVAFSADDINFLYKPNDGICNTNVLGTNIVGGIPDIQAGDTVDVYVLNMNNTSQPSAHVATAVISASNI